MKTSFKNIIVILFFANIICSDDDKKLQIHELTDFVESTQNSKSISLFELIDVAKKLNHPMINSEAKAATHDNTFALSAFKAGKSLKYKINTEPIYHFDIGYSFNFIYSISLPINYFKPKKISLRNRDKSYIIYSNINTTNTCNVNEKTINGFFTLSNVCNYFI